jgi:hypothetical protein
MKPEERIISELIKRFDAVEDAQRALQEAKSEQKKSWAEILERHSRVNDEDFLDRWRLPEVVIVQDGTFVYQITFDYDEWNPPIVRRVEDFTQVMNSREWS